ncbi:unnamed protein product, partial [Medioppia subpectinata]
DGQRWVCPKCTVENHSALTYCEVCELPRNVRLIDVTDAAAVAAIDTTDSSATASAQLSGSVITAFIFTDEETTCGQYMQHMDGHRLEFITACAVRQRHGIHRRTVLAVIPLAGALVWFESTLQFTYRPLFLLKNPKTTSFEAMSSLTKCTTCDLPVESDGAAADHNCVDGLKKAAANWEAMYKSSEIECILLRKKCNELNEMLHSLPFTAHNASVTYGTHRITVGQISVTEGFVEFHLITEPEGAAQPLDQPIIIAYSLTKKLLVCPDPALMAICFKESANAITTKLFGLQTDDMKHEKYMVLAFDRLMPESVVNRLKECYARITSGSMYEIIDRQAAQQINRYLTRDENRSPKEIFGDDLCEELLSFLTFEDRFHQMFANIYRNLPQLLDLKINGLIITDEVLNALSRLTQIRCIQLMGTNNSTQLAVNRLITNCPKVFQNNYLFSIPMVTLLATSAGERLTYTVVVNRNRLTRCAIHSFTSIMANRLPMQLRGPVPNGRVKLIRVRVIALRSVNGVHRDLNQLSLEYGYISAGTGLQDNGLAGLALQTRGHWV